MRKKASNSDCVSPVTTVQGRSGYCSRLRACVQQATCHLQSQVDGCSQGAWIPSTQGWWASWQSGLWPRGSQGLVAVEGRVGVHEDRKASWARQGLSIFYRHSLLFSSSHSLRTVEVLREELFVLVLQTSK